MLTSIFTYNVKFEFQINRNKFTEYRHFDHFNRSQLKLSNSVTVYTHRYNDFIQYNFWLQNNTHFKLSRTNMQILLSCIFRYFPISCSAHANINNCFTLWCRGLDRFLKFGKLVDLYYIVRLIGSGDFELWSTIEMQLNA